MRKGAFIDANNRRVKPGDRVEYQYGGRGKVIEVFQDGDCTVRFDDGHVDTVKFVRLCKETSP